MITFLLAHIIAFLVLLAAAWGAGSIVARRLRCENVVGLLSVRVVAGLAALGPILFGAGLAGCLTPRLSVVVATLAVAAVTTGLRELRAATRPSAIESVGAVAVAVPLFLLSLYPPLAFDETLYHLPTVRRFATTGGLPFIDYLRVPVFPHFDEVLRVPLFQLGGDIATHLLSLLATLATAGLLLAWFRERDEAAAGWLASALFLSAPLVVQLGTTGYVDALMTMFVAAAFYAFDRWRLRGELSWLLAAGAFAGCSASVKYLGAFWVGALCLAVFTRKGWRIRDAMLFALTAAIVLAPWYGRILYFTGNPIFPFASRIFGDSQWNIVAAAPRSLMFRLVELIRLPWDVLFDRARTGQQPPCSPFLVALIPVVAIRSFRDPLIRVLALVVAVWCAVWVWLPPDARYLEVALPLASAAGALAVSQLLSHARLDARRMLGVAAISIALAAPAYAIFRISRYGPIPVSFAVREAFLARQVPEYGAIGFLNARSNVTDVAWLCGGEQLAYHFRGLMFGDLAGPARFDLVAFAPDAATLDWRAAGLGARYVVVVKAQCNVPALAAVDASRWFTLRYDDSKCAVYERTVR